jgi:hypothetical protein
VGVNPTAETCLAELTGELVGETALGRWSDPLHLAISHIVLGGEASVKSNHEPLGCEVPEVLDELGDLFHTDATLKSSGPSVHEKRDRVDGVVASHGRDRVEDRLTSVVAGSSNAVNRASVVLVDPVDRVESEGLGDERADCIALAF